MLIPKHILLFIFNLFIITLLQGQSNQEDLSDIERAELILNNLEKGVLLIKIPTGSKKINEMEKAFARDNGNLRLLTLRNKEIQRIQHVQEDLMQGFKKHYSFSSFIGVYDTNYIKVLKTPAIKGVFVDADLNIVKDFTLSGKAFATFREDQFFYDETRAREGFTLSDNLGLVPNHPLGLGVPYKFKRHPIMPTGGTLSRIECPMDLFQIYNYKTLDKNPYYAIVKILQIKLVSYRRYLFCRQY